jgi:hypothetical protein
VTLPEDVRDYPDGFEWPDQFIEKEEQLKDAIRSKSELEIEDDVYERRAQTVKESQSRTYWY